MPRRKNFDEQITKHFYTAKQAQQKLGMKQDKFNYTVKTRGIERVPFLGGYGYYKKSDIDRLAEEIEAFLLMGSETSFQYRAATMEDIDDEIELAALNFGRKQAEATQEARVKFLKANPEVTHYLFNNDRLVAAINLVPLTHDAILEFREGKRGWLFDTNQIEQFEAGHPLECIIIDMMTTTRATLDQRHRFASYLLRDLGSRTLIDWARRGIDIATIDACAGTEDGERILKRAGFEFLGKCNERDIYHLDCERSHLPLLQSYKEIMAENKQMH